MSNDERFEMLCEKLGYNPMDRNGPVEYSSYIDDNDDPTFDRFKPGELTFMADYMYEKRTGIKVLS